MKDDNLYKLNKYYLHINDESLKLILLQIFLMDWKFARFMRITKTPEKIYVCIISHVRISWKFGIIICAIITYIVHARQDLAVNLAL